MKCSIIKRTFIYYSTIRTVVFGWTSSSMTNEGLVNNLIRDGVVSSESVANVLRRLDRREFAKTLASPLTQRSVQEAYRDVSLYLLFYYIYIPLYTVSITYNRWIYNFSSTHVGKST